MGKYVVLIVGLGALAGCGTPRDPATVEEALLLGGPTAMRVRQCLRLPPGPRRARCLFDVLHPHPKPPADAGRPSDGGHRDATVDDARVPPDGGRPDARVDAGAPDAHPDARAPDARPDAGGPAARPDAGPPDARLDAAAADAGPDAAAADAGPDAAAADGGLDAASSDGGSGPAVCAQPSPGYVFANVGSGGGPQDVAAIAPGEVWGISIGSLQRWDGSAWAPVAVPFTWASSQIGVLAGSSGNDVWVTNGGSTVVRWDGSSWIDVSPPLVPAGSIVTDLRVIGPSDAWVINQWLVNLNWQYELLHWNGVGWTNVALPAEAQPVAGLLGLWATSSDDVWLIGYVAQTGAPALPMLLHWDGATVRSLAMPPGSPVFKGLKAIWASSASDIWVAGYTASAASSLWHFDRTTWTEVDFPASGSAFNKIWGWCASNVWAFSYTGIWHYDGTTWSQVRAVDSGAESLSGTGPDDVWASGGGTADLVMHWQSAALGSCGDGAVEPGEDCDPPNGTTCDSQCHAIPIVCGNGIVQPGETCEYPGTYLCQNCQLTTCGQCFSAFVTGANTVCSGLGSDDTLSCEKLVNCLATGFGRCLFTLRTSLGCYCSDDTCSQGANGPCAFEVQALAHSQDPTTVMGQISNPQTPVGRVFSVMTNFGSSSCGRSCSGG